MMFDANCQTEKELIFQYVAKSNKVVETATDPEMFMNMKSVATLMVQTDPMIAENVTVDEPITLQQPQLPSNINMITKMPNDDKKPSLQLPKINERDWFYSNLYQYVQS